MAKRKWYVVTVGRDIGIFPTWIEAGPLVKGVPSAIHQSFSTRAEATQMFAQEQARGRTRIVDPDLDSPAVNSPQRARNYSAPSPFPQAMSTFGMTPMPRAHDRSPLSVHPTTTSSRNRTACSTPSPVFPSDRRAPIVNGTSNSAPVTPACNPRSGLNMSPSMRRFQMIQAALEQKSNIQSQGQVRPLVSNTNTSNSRSLTPTPGPSSSSRSRALHMAKTPPDISRGIQSSGPLPPSATRIRESASTSVGFVARAPPVSHFGHSSHTNTYPYTPNVTTTGGARASNPAVKSTSEPTSPSRGFQRTPTDTFRSNSRRAEFGDSLGRSSVSPRAIVRTPEWLPSYPTSRTPSPDSDSSVRTGSPSPGPRDELLSPLSNVNLNSFALDSRPQWGSSDTAERNTPSPFVRSSTRSLNTQTQSPLALSNGTPPPSFTTTSNRSGSIQSQGAPHRRIEITHASDPRSPTLSPYQIPALACKKSTSSALELSFSNPSPRVDSRPVASSPLSNFSINGHGPSLLFRH